MKTKHSYPSWINKWKENIVLVFCTCTGSALFNVCCDLFYHWEFWFKFSFHSDFTHCVIYCLALTSVTAGTVGRSSIHTGSTGVVTQVTPATWLVLAPGTLRYTAALIQSPAADNDIKTTFSAANTTKSTHMNYVSVNELNVFISQHGAYSRVTQIKLRREGGVRFRFNTKQCGSFKILMIIWSSNNEIILCTVNNSLLYC